MALAWLRRPGRDHVRLLADRPAAVPAAQRADVGRRRWRCCWPRGSPTRGVPRLAAVGRAGGAGGAARAAAGAELRRLARALAAGDRVCPGPRPARRLHRLLPARRPDGVPVLHRHRQAADAARAALDPAGRAVGFGQALRRALRHPVAGADRRAAPPAAGGCGSSRATRARPTARRSRWPTGHGSCSSGRGSSARSDTRASCSSDTPLRSTSSCSAAAEVERRLAFLRLEGAARQPQRLPARRSGPQRHPVEREQAQHHEQHAVRPEQNRPPLAAHVAGRTTISAGNAVISSPRVAAARTPR